MTLPAQFSQITFDCGMADLQRFGQIAHARRSALIFGFTNGRSLRPINGCSPTG
jgi:hypothetical protein